MQQRRGDIARSPGGTARGEATRHLQQVAHGDLAARVMIPFADDSTDGVVRPVAQTVVEGSTGRERRELAGEGLVVDRRIETCAPPVSLDDEVNGTAHDYSKRAVRPGMGGFRFEH